MVAKVLRPNPNSAHPWMAAFAAAFGLMMPVTALLLMALAAALLFLSPAAHAGVLYKSIGPNGIVQFSDSPPRDGTIVEQRTIGSAPAAPTPAANPLQGLADGSDDDEALARANTQVDLAEHALALARHALDVDPAHMRLDVAARTRADDDRIAFYEHDLKLARNNLLEMLKARRAALAAAAAEPGAPQLGPLHKIASR